MLYGNFGGIDIRKIKLPYFILLNTPRRMKYCEFKF